MMSCLALSYGLLQYDWRKRNGILPQVIVKSCIHDIMFNPLSEKPTNIYNLAVYNVQPSDEGWYIVVWLLMMLGVQRIVHGWRSTVSVLDTYDRTKITIMHINIVVYAYT